MFEKVKAAIAQLEYCYEEAPLDFLGTGSDGEWANQQEIEWRASFTNAIRTLKEELGIAC